MTPITPNTGGSSGAHGQQVPFNFSHEAATNGSPRHSIASNSSGLSNPPSPNVTGQLRERDNYDMWQMIQKWRPQPTWVIICITYQQGRSKSLFKNCISTGRIVFSTSKLVLNLFSPYLVGSAKSNRWGLSISPLLSTNHQVILEIHRQVTIKFYSLDGNSENTWMRRGNQLVLGFLFYYFVFGLVGTFPSSRSSGALGYSSTQSSTLISLPTLNQTTPSSDRCESNCSMYLIRVLQQLLHSFFFFSASPPSFTRIFLRNH